MSSRLNRLDTFRNKRVLVTGHTGFKGSWLTAWLDLIGAKVFGLSLPPPTEPSHIKILKLSGLENEYIQDITDFEKVSEIITSINPDFVFHLAAQPIVKTAYLDPVTTWKTNVLGTQSILEAMRKINKKVVSIFITSDKCYENVEWVWGYKETDKLGGKDPYSSSKAAAEILLSSYARSLVTATSQKYFASVRAGNVIGGGDWASDRIIPDIIRSWYVKKLPVVLRNPFSTRPWQHVLEPLGGYLHLGAMMWDNDSEFDSYNFGPPSDQNKTVLDVVKKMDDLVPKDNLLNRIEIKNDGPQFNEAGLLKLNCEKALTKIGWKPLLDFELTIEMTAMWYEEYLSKGKIITKEQIRNYMDLL